MVGMRTEATDRSIETALPRLPTEVWAEVAAKIHRDDVMAFALTSKQLREAQQQAGRKLVTRPYWEDPPGLHVSSYHVPTFFSRDWCAWWMKRFNMTETKDECMKSVIKVAACLGYLDVLKTYWSNTPEEKKPLLMNGRTSEWAAMCGRLEVLKWLRSKGCPCDEVTYAYAATRGHLEVLKWLRSEDCPWDEWACSQAAGYGHLEILKWLRSEGCPWSEVTCAGATIPGHLEVLKWLRSEGCPWDRDAYAFAATYGHLEILKWLRSKGCPWDEKACSGAATYGHLQVLKWLRSEGCPWDEEECRTVGEPNIVRWIEAQSSSP